MDYMTLESDGDMPMPMPNNTMNMDMDMSMMHMTFYSHYSVHLFFDSWKFDTDSKYAGALVALFLVSVFIEALNWIKSSLKIYGTNYTGC